MRKALAVAAVFALVAGGCLAARGNEKPVFVDYTHDEFASFVARNFPRQLAVHPGTELVFRQTWTGEPHSVTGGTLADELMEAVRPYMEMQERGEEIPDEPPKKIMALEEKVAWSYSEEDDGGFNQTGAQPCYLTSGEPRTDGEPCEEQEQPEFTGKQSFYNSGLIPYEGPQGNEYRVKLADDIDPGSYWFYCNFHGEFQSTEVVVKPTDEDVPSVEEINRQVRQETAKVTDPFARLVDDARDDGRLGWRNPETKRSTTIEGNFAGLFNPELDEWHSINEFVPKTITARAGEPITWNLIGFHTISFGVPRYFPIMTFEEDGTVKRNSKLDPPAGGAREFDMPEDEQYDESREDPVEFDGGTYDGDGFWSSGTIDALPWIEYTVRIEEPGTYRYACLIHPPMVGTVEVT